MTKSGFFNSLDHDRIYGPDDIGGLYEGIITDGIIPGYLGGFTVVRNNNTSVMVGSGKAWLNHTWIANNDAVTLQLNAKEAGQARCDAVCIEVNKTNSIRETRILLVDGTNGSLNPPIMETETGTGGVILRKQYMLAYIERPATGNIRVVNTIGTTLVGNTTCPYATSMIHMGDPMFDESGYPTPQQHNGIFRGNNLGGTMTAAQFNAIVTGNFDGLYIGDYWDFNGTKFRIAGFNYYNIPQNHIVIVPDACINSSVITNNNAGTYLSCGAQAALTVDAHNYEKMVFTDSHILSVPHRIVATYNTGVMETHELKYIVPSQVAMYGSNLYPNADNDISSDRYQLPLFALAPKFINSADFRDYFLRDVGLDKYNGRSKYNVIQSGSNNTEYKGAPYIYSIGVKGAGVREMFCVGG